MARIFRMPAVMKRSGLSRSSIYRQVRAGTFPPPVRISANAVGWREADLEEWAEALPTGTAEPPVHRKRREKTAAR